MIDRVLFQIWVGTPLPQRYRDWGRKLAEMNPKWEYRLHGDDLLTRYGKDPIIEWMLGTKERWAFIVDRLRVLLLRDEGGVYMDCDCFPVKPLDTLKIWDDPRVGFVAGMRSPDRRHVSLSAPGISLIDNTVLASERNGVMANRLCDLYTATARKHTGMSMGREIIRNADERTVLLNWRYFYAEDKDPASIVLHDAMNLGSWTGPREMATT